MDPSILYLGMTGTFSLYPLKALLDAGLKVCGIVVPWRPLPPDMGTACARLEPPDPVGQLPMLNPFLEYSIIQLGWERDIPVFQVSRFGEIETLSLLSQLQPDVAAVACYPDILPPSALELAPHGFINIHPSRLPDFRGPDPLFWSFREGVTETAVTLHLMGELPDSGPIVKQAALHMPEGVSGGEAELLCAKLGAELLVEAMRALSKGALPSRPQPPGGSSFPLPTVQDFRLSLNWTARRAFNFMRAAADRGVPFQVEVGDEKIALVEAVAYRQEYPSDKKLVWLGRDAWIRFAAGILHGRAGGRPDRLR